MSLEIHLPPTAPVGLWRRFTAAYALFLSIVLSLAVGLLIIPVSLQIFSRYTELIPSYIWTEEMARFLFVWMIIAPIMIGVRDGGHGDDQQPGEQPVVAVEEFAHGRSDGFVPLAPPRPGGAAGGAAVDVGSRPPAAAAGCPTSR